MNSDGKSKEKKGKKEGYKGKKTGEAVGTGESVVASEQAAAGSNEFTAGARQSIFGNEPTASGPAGVEIPEGESEVRIGDRTMSKVEVEKMDMVIAGAKAAAAVPIPERETELRVPKADPLKQVRIMHILAALQLFSFVNIM